MFFCFIRPFYLPGKKLLARMVNTIKLSYPFKKTMLGGQTIHSYNSCLANEPCMMMTEGVIVYILAGSCKFFMHL